jgi:POT family proton-dependent oligopeptide transporter
VVKLSIGCLLNAASYLVMVAAAFSAGDGKTSWLWLFAYFVVITVGEIYLSPTSLSLVTKVAPASLLSMMMGVWLATSFVGNFLAGYLGTFWSSMSRVEFFFMLALISTAASAAIALLSIPLRGALKD